MHPGPVNRGVELSGEVVDSPQAVITMQVKAGVVVRMAVLYEVLAGAREPRARARRARPSRSSHEPRVPHARPRDGGGALAPGARAPTRAARPRARRPADLLVRGAHVLDPRTGLDGPHDVLVRDGEIAEIGAAGSLAATADVETIDGAGRHLFPAFVDPHVHLRTPGQEHKEDLETGTRSAAAGGYCAVVAMPNTAPGRRLRADPRRAARRRRARGARARRLHRRDHPRPARRASSPRWPSCASSARAAFTDDGRPVVDAGVFRRALQYQRLCGGVLALHEEDPALSGKGAMHEGAISTRARRPRDPERQRVDDDRPRLRARRVRGRAHPHPAPLRARVGRGRSPPRRRAACRSPARRARTT